MKIDNLEIIKLSENEWEKYKNLRLKALKDNPEAFGLTYDEATLKKDDEWRMLLNVSDDGRKRWVFFAQLNGSLVGMVSGQAMETVKDGVKVREMYVSKEVRGKGIAKKLLEVLEKELLKNSDRKVLRVGVLKKSGVMKFYINQGFKILEEKTEVFPNGISHESFIMEKILE